MNACKVTILLPVYNGEPFLDECILSIREQSYSNLEILIINDGSTDNSEAIIQKHVASDCRIIYIKQENKGLIETLNLGLRIATGKYIARIDADDICLSNRIEVQVERLESTNTDVCGSHYYEIDSDGKVIRERMVPVDNLIIDMSLIARVPFAHPSVMFRTSFFREHCIFYGSDKKLYAEDLELWCRIKKAGAKFSNSDHFLLKYRVLNGSLSRINKNRIYQDAIHLTSVFFEKNRCSLCNEIKNRITENKFNKEEEEILLAFIFRIMLHHGDFSLFYLIKLFSVRVIVKSFLREVKQYRSRVKFKG